jgi:hypothetical protein
MHVVHTGHVAEVPEDVEVADKTASGQQPMAENIELYTHALLGSQYNDEALIPLT